MEYFCFVLNPLVCVDTAWEALTAEGFQILYADEDSDGKQLFGYPPLEVKLSELLDQFVQIKNYYSVTFDEINWCEQWGTNTSKWIDLTEYSGQSFQMAPGPGFGDLSHPTTRLALRIMATCVSGKFVIDLGCGSGILSFAAAKLGASGVCGIDIDPDALAHANKNLELNEDLKNIIHFQFPKDPLDVPVGSSVILVMNMIHQEQEAAWNSLPFLHEMPMTCITSGILGEEKQEKTYLEMCKIWGWVLEESNYEGSWAGYRFLNISRKRTDDAKDS